MRPRFEHKYVVDLATADRFRCLIEEAMVPDPHAEDGSYRVQSLYYDSAEHRAYYEKLDGVDRRFKIRLRGYGPRPEQEVTTFFLEAKHRQGQRLGKTRLALPASRVPELVAGPSLRLANDLGTEPSEAASILEGLIHLEPLFPVCVVVYVRQPFVSRIDPTLRVTFDRELEVGGPLTFPMAAGERGMTVLPRDLCVLEIKFHWAMPLWILEACRELGLLQRRYSKYCQCAGTLIPDLAPTSIRFQDALLP